ncbi:MAG: 4Fe-4S binding protein [Planctomycetes bacterium]|nr:4Fe-4S binding protein [Planctomycetota bacterium]
MPHYIHDTCIGCTACLTKCPTEAIVGDKKQLHVIIQEKCIDCGVCGNVCPVTCITDQFDRLVPKKQMTARPRPVINKDNCTGCEYCVDYCPEDVLAMRNCDDGHVKVSHLVGEKKCIGCALCAEICPHDAIHMTEADECKELLEAGIITKYYVRNAAEPVAAAS